jgi:Lon protease-like protein
MVRGCFSCPHPEAMTLQLPLFPLQTVLFPGGVLPLRIFEVRYLDLMQRCIKESAPFGVVSLSRGSEVRSAEQGDAETFHAVGTLAHIEAVERPQPGLMMVRCRGGQRFRLQGSQQMKHGLWIGEVEFMADDAAVAIPPDLAEVRDSLQRLYEHLRAQADAQDALPIQGPLKWDDCAWVANRWCELLPMGQQLKQQFLALDNPLLRLELVGDVLERMNIGDVPPANVS